MSLIEREKRMGLHLLVEVRGEDVAGARFTEYARSINVSGGGICFESHRHISVGARLELAIELPVSLRRHFGNQDVYRAQAVVCRVERFEGEPASRVGARFLGEAAQQHQQELLILLMVFDVLFITSPDGVTVPPTLDNPVLDIIPPVVGVIEPDKTLRAEFINAPALVTVPANIFPVLIRTAPADKNSPTMGLLVLIVSAPDGVLVPLKD